MANHMVSLHWKYDGVEQTVLFANLDDAKLCYQALYGNGIAAGYMVPEGYKEIPFKRYEGDGILSESEMLQLAATIQNMQLVNAAV